MSRRRILVSGGTGYVGRFIVNRLLAAGHELVVGSRSEAAAGFFDAPVRTASMRLGEPPQPHLFHGIDCFVHGAFDHLPGKYRGGEGGDPSGFRRRNLDGSIALFEAAKTAGVRTIVFLSSRAVYGTQPAGEVLTEETAPHPDTLYGEVKLAAERHLLAMASPTLRPIVLRVTGVYGSASAGREEKWGALIDDYLAGRRVAARVATEVHGDDVARAVQQLLPDPDATGVFNVSDVTVDHRDLLAMVRDATDCPHALPDRTDASTLNIMSTDKLRSHGWQPGGRDLFEQTVREMALARRSHSDSTG